MSQINPQYNYQNPNQNNIPSFQEFQSAFNLINQQNNQRQLYFQMQHDQFLFFCQQRNLNPNDPNALKLFHQQISGGNSFPQQQAQPFYSQPPIQPGFPQPQIQPGFPQPNYQPGFPHNQIQSNFNYNLNNNINNINNINKIQPGFPHHQINSQPPHNPMNQFSSINTSNINSSNSVYLPGGNKMKEVLPRGDKTLYVEPEDKNAANLMNISFKASSGLNVMIPIAGNAPIKTLFQKYMDKLKLPYNYLGNELQFLYNGNKIDPFSNELVSKKFKNNIFITVFDQGGVIGAL